MELSARRAGQWIMLLLGVFSTLQIVTIFGVTVFNLIALVAFLYFFLIEWRWYKSPLNGKILIFLLLCGITTVWALLNNATPRDYKSVALTSCINYFILFGVFIATKNGPRSYIDKFTSGFKISCNIQIIWCILQLLLFYIFSVDLNHVIFNRLLGTTDLTSRYVDGVLVCTGLSWHPANLIPILAFCFFYYKNIVLKLVCVVLAILSHSATAQIAIGLCCLYAIIREGKQLLFARSSVKQWTLAVLLISILLIYAATDNNLIVRTINSVLDRIRDIHSTEGGNSSATHFSYYLRLGEIYEQTDIVTILFGYGIGCSGVPYSMYFNQYTDQIWVVESDFINLLLSQGLFGFIAFYVLFISIIVKCAKRSKQAAVFLLILLICGVTYNLQYNWVILVELMMYTMSKRGTSSLHDVRIKEKKSYFYNKCQAMPI